ncbi:MAG: hypothetical protein OQK73_12105 [Gammaproteobacteria bacterium]|nr:hypothetical protein [Gammaproteobacteria bacterium]
MNTVQVYIDETLDSQGIDNIKTMVMAMPHVHNVEMNNSMPHDMLVEYDAHHNMPMEIIEKLEDEGIHPDIISA